MSPFLLFIINIILVTNNDTIILQMSKISMENKIDKEEIILALLYKYSTFLYVGHPPQKIDEIFLEDNKNYSVMILGKESELIGDICDIDKITDLYNYSYYIETDNEIIEYANINTSITLGTINNIFLDKNIFYTIQYNPNYIYPNSGFINLEHFIKDNLLIEYINDEKYFFYINSKPEYYDLRYKETTLERIHLPLLKINGEIKSNLKFWSFSQYSFITLSTSNIYFYYYIFLGCTYQIINDFRYYFCPSNQDLSKLKIELDDIIINENDLVYQTDEYKIPLIRFGLIDDSTIQIGIYLVKNSLFIDFKSSMFFRYKNEDPIALRINTIERIPFNGLFNFKEKSLDGNDIFPLRFIYKINRNSLEDLDINFDLKNVNSEFIVEVIIIMKDFIELLQKGILSEKIHNEKLVFNTLKFSINKYKILPLMYDEEKDFYIYFVVKKSDKNYNIYKNLNCELSIDFQNNNIIEIGKNIFGQLGNLDEILLLFKSDTLLKGRQLEQEASSSSQYLIIQVALENNLDFSIINKTLIKLNNNKNYFYKNCTNFRLVEKYSDKTIVYINMTNKNIDDLMINIFKKNKNIKNSGYKLKYYIGNLFDIPYYQIFNNDNIKYEKIITNDKLNLKLKIPNINIIIDNMVEGFANSTFVVKIFEFENNFIIDADKPLIYTDSYKNIFSTEFNSTEDNIINKEINNIKINNNKKYIITTYGNISDNGDIILYDSFLFVTEQEKGRSSYILAIIIPILSIIIIIIIVAYLYYKKKNCFKKKEENNQKEIQMIEK